MLRALILATPFLLTPVIALGPVTPAAAQTNEAQVIVPDSALSVSHPEIHALLDGMGLYDILQVMSQEGIASADDMQADMFPGQGGSAWTAVVAGIYSADQLIADFEAAFPTEAMDADTLAALSAFVTSDLGQSIAEGEVAARVAFLEPGVQERATEIANQMRADGDPRMELLSAFIDNHSLVERNVSGALNSNYAFFLGLSDGNAFDMDMPEDLMLAQIWGQEPEIRSSTTDWLYAFFVTAYSDLSEAELAEHVAFSETDAGQVLNGALFSAFDVMLERVSYDLGVAAAAFIAGEET